VSGVDRRLGQRGECTGLQAARAASPPELASMRSGVWARETVIMRCSACALQDDCEWHDADPDGLCGWELAYYDARRPMYARVLAAAGHDVELHGPLIDIAIDAEIRVYRARAYNARRGEIDDLTREYTGVAREVKALQAAVRAAREDLNLTPAAIAKLETARAGDELPDLVRGVLAAQERREQRVQEAEFTVEDEADTATATAREAE